METERTATPTATQPPRLMSVREAARALGVSDRFLRQLEARGQVRFTRLGRRVLLRVTEVERLATEGAR